MMMIFVYISWQLRQKHRKQQEVASLDVVTRLCKRQYNIEKRKGNEAEECAICLEDYLFNDELRVLPCNHDFHAACVDAWLTTQKKFVSDSKSHQIRDKKKLIYYFLYIKVSYL
jgi:E3 ubiquitin-protein ligase RNF13